MKTIRILLAALCCGVALGAQAEMKLVVHKEARKLEVVRDGRVVETYAAALGFEPVGTKQRQGDGRTPEGTYFVRVKNAKSQYYLSLGLDYPNRKDAERGLRDRLIGRTQYDAILAAARRGTMPPANTQLGGEIFIHGGGTGRDWTFGCVALDNPNMKRLFETTPLGTRVDILP